MTPKLSKNNLLSNPFRFNYGISLLFTSGVSKLIKDHKIKQIPHHYFITAILTHFEPGSTAFLRQKGLPQSKPVDFPHSETGD